MGIEAKTKLILLGGSEIPVYLMPDGEYRWSMRQVSKAIGFNEGWLSDTMRAEGNALQVLKEKGFKGDLIELSGQGFIESNLISTTDFMAAIMYAAVIGMRRPAVALLASSLHETLERRADHAFGIIRDEDEYIQKFEYRYASILLNKNLKAAISDWISRTGIDGVNAYCNEYKIRGGQQGVYATALGEIYQVLFGQNKRSINEVLGVKHYQTPKDNVEVTQLQRIAQIEDLASKYIMRKNLSPLEAIRAAADALMIELETPRLGDRITRADVYKVLKVSKSPST